MAYKVDFHVNGIRFENTCTSHYGSLCEVDCVWLSEIGFRVFITPFFCDRYILIYPQGCDVCNHLSLFLCVANHDKLLPGMLQLSCISVSLLV